ncbi:putative serine protease PepD [Streptomyces sp. DvalAA-14]|uniref:S1C family serine protease n=1 Tax=unclassified Streptomyces TaxID=2593676 RepID=UPI00081B1CE2|nr:MULTISPECIES: trypsin-like peptidase domain-containing protein [unclassified Streptomyces]MYS22856.1 trypsin-like serine protease [Streptomyces sp. SID4948]SCE23519.1 putative serine protease PepD [Streptomyces sp. DvalAA-14]
MTESNRYSGEPQDPHDDPQAPLYFGPQTPPEAAPAADEGVGHGFPPPPSYAPPTYATPGYASPAPGDQLPGDQLPGDQLTGDHTAHRRRRSGKPFALFAAVALAAGVIGGGAGALIGHSTDHHDTAAATTAAINASAIDGSVSGVAKAVSPSVVEINATSNSGKSTGAGVIITADGQIVTNNHVIAGSDNVSVVYSNGRTASASVVGTDPQKDLALIKVQGASGLPAATLGNSAGLVVGDQVVAIGSPDGLAGTVTSGIVSALNRDVTVPVEDGQGQDQQQFGGGGDDGSGGGSGRWPFSFGGNQYNGDTGSSTTTYKAIQTDASLNPGNSGGALINMSGQIIGLNSAMFSSSDSSSGDSSGAGSVGLGFAIPINTVTSDLAHLRAGGTGTN